MRRIIDVTDPTPVLAYMASYRAWAADSGVPFEQTIERAGQLLTEILQREWVFTRPSTARR